MATVGLKSLALLAQTNAPAPADAFKNWAKDNPASMTVMVIVVIAAGLAFALYRAKMRSTAERATEDDFRHLVAKSVLFSAIWGTVVVAGLAIVFNGAKEILSIILPVFGTWVGALLAYYFGKDNYEAGARNSASMAKVMSGLEKLRSIPVTQAGIMIPASKIELPPAMQGKKPADYAQVLLKDVIAGMKQQRLPLFDPATGAPLAVIHKSLINDFLVKQGPQKFDTATLAQLLADPEAGKIAKNTFVILPNTATLADVKLQMSEQCRSAGLKCEDAFITTPGSQRVEGWITNDIIDENSQV
jgi:hypothetical protein